MSADAPSGSGAVEFTTTHWSLVLRARGTDPTARDALGQLIRTYWYPVYAYFRRKIGSADQAEDLTQGIFTHLLDGNALAQIDPARGRFRSFLLACCDHFLSNDRARATARKRGGGVELLSLDLVTAGTRYGAEPAEHLTPERLYARLWALDLLAAALNDLAAEYRDGAGSELFDRLRPTLTATDDAPTYAVIAAELGMSVPAVKKAAQRLRERYGAALRRCAAATVDDPAEVDEEIRELFEALAAR
jgi:DNA-directed RNA polymerase specialized sigma24 family protein